MEIRKLRRQRTESGDLSVLSDVLLSNIGDLLRGGSERIWLKMYEVQVD